MESTVFECSCPNPQVESRISSVSQSATVGTSSSVSCVTIPNSPTHTKRKCCIKQRLWSAFDSERMSDVLFIVGEGENKQKISAHKILLCVGSDVFNTMFSEIWSFKSSVIEVPDIEPATFKALLRFLYTDEVLITSDNVVSMLYVARKYSVEPLESRCVDFLIESLCPSNAFTILNQAGFFGDQKLMNSCLEMIDKDTVEALAGDGFCDVDTETLCLVLERNTLTISETQLFDTVVRWSKAKCARKNLPVNPENQRSVLKEVLPLLRFPLMSVDEFLSKIPSSGLLTSDELVTMSRYYSASPKPAISFNTFPRHHSEFIVNRFGRVEHGFPCYAGYFDEIDFICDRNVQLLGVGFYNSISRLGQYDLSLLIKERTSGRVLYETKGIFKSDLVSTYYRVLFEKPVKITASTKYNVYSTIVGPDTFFGKQGIANVTVDLPYNRKVTVSFFTSRPNERRGTRVDQGQIPVLIFST